MFHLAEPRAPLRTFVARLDPAVPREQLTSRVLLCVAQGASVLADSRRFAGDRRVAVVLSESDDAVYFIHTTAAPKTLGNHAASLRAAILGSVLGSRVAVRWVRPLNRHLQRAFGWGDIAATAADIQAAAAAARDDGETGPLRELLPWLGHWTLLPKEDEEWERTSCEDIMNMLPSLPRLFATLRQEAPLAVKDCEHSWQETRGPCSHAVPGGPCRQTYLWPSFYRCRGGCDKVVCRGCVEDMEDDAKEKRLVEQFRKRCEPGVTVFGCFMHQPHPEQPAPFFVLDSEKMPDDEKLEWLGREFPTRAQETSMDDLPAFAALCLALFGSHVRGEVPQKALIFKLFSRFCGERVRLVKEADVPPNVREKLGQMWDKTVLLCHECGGALGATPIAEDVYGEENHWCSQACEHAAKDYKFRCPDCGSADSVPGSVRTKWDPFFGHRVVGDRTATCAGCHQEHSYRVERWQSWMGPRPQRTDRPGPPREPAWKRRRRA